MRKSELTHITIEKIALYLIVSIIIIFALYYFVFKIDWVGVYKNQSSEKSLSLLNENCLSCHGEVTGFSQFHDPKIIGCSSCHLGETKVKNKEAAHMGMVLIPGNNYDAKKTCGQTNCHPGISERIDSSLMSTMSGIISVNKFAFDEIKKPEGKFHIEEIGRTASESHLRNLCASCHLGNTKKEFGPISELSRGGGCNACHLNYSKEALIDLTQYDSLKIAKPDSALLKFHPSLSLNITNNHCFGCHSRSGRISTSYEGWHETSLTKGEISEDKNFRVLDDGRIFKMIQPDVHFEAGLVCVDCHISYEVMGDGKFYEHKEDQILVQCDDCHSTKLNTIRMVNFDYESGKIAEINNITDKKQKFVKVKKSGTPLINTYFENGRTPKLRGKQTNKIYNLNTPKLECLSESHSSLSCSSCHTAWAPQCVGCHTEYQPGTEGFDLLENKDTDSTWMEYHGEYFAELPTLGVKQDIETNEKIVDTFIPGMIMTLDKSKYGSEKPELIFKRLFAPSNAHTISKKSRNCESCHNSSLALGYGRGELEYVVHNKIGRWLFQSRYQNSEFDNLPEDAWIGFLKLPNDPHSTRSNVRPFNIDEQKQILTVGACLTCHNGKSEIMRNTLYNFNQSLMSISNKCIIPTWD